MKSVLYCYFMNHRLAVAGKLLWVALVGFIVINSIINDIVNFFTLFVTMPSGFLLSINTNTKLDRYFRIMPIRPRTIVLARFIQSFVSLAVGTVLSAIIVLIFSHNLIPDFNFMLLYLGVFMASLAVGNVLSYIVLNKYWYASYGSYLLPIALAYIVFSPATIHDLVRDTAAGTHMMESAVFANSTPFIIFAAISFIAFMCSHAASAALLKKTDHQESINWLMYI